MRVSRVLVTTLSLVALMSTGVLEGHAQSNNQLDQITVDTGQQITAGEENQKPTNDVEGTILENPAVGVPGVVVTYQDFERIQPQDLQDVFANETSVSVGGSTPISQKIYVNGIEDRNLAVSVDGAVQSNDVFHHTGTLLIDPSLLKAARVDPGVAPADAGPGALGGSIQFETVDVKDLLEPGKNFGGFVTLSYDTNSETFSTGVSAYTRSNGFEALGFYKLSDGDNWEAGNGEEQLGTAADLQTALGKLAYEAQSGDRFEISYEWVNDDALRPFRPNLASVNFGPPTEPKEFNLKRNSFVFNYTDETPQGWWDPKLVIAYNETKLEYLDIPYSNLKNMADIDTWSGKFENKFRMSNGSVVAGLDFFHTNAEGGTIGDPVYGPGTEKDRNIGAYAQARFDIMKNARLSFGGRIDHQMFTGVDGTDIDNTGFSGNISGEYDLNEIITLKAGYAHVFGRIPLAEALLNYSNYTYDGLDTYHSDNFTVGLSAEYRGFTFDTSYSIVKMDDAIGHNSGFGSLSRNNLLDVESKSFDVAVGYKWATGFARAKYANIEVTGNDLPIYTLSWGWGTNIGEIITLEAAHKFEQYGITIGADMQIVLEQNEFSNIWAGPPDNTPGNPLPSYEVVNAFIQYDTKTAFTPELTLRAEVNNIFDEEYADRATSGLDYSAYFQPLLEPGRSVYFSAKAKF